MSILSRPRFQPQQRLDLEDVNALLSALRTDSKLYNKQLVANTNLIYKGFTVSGIGLKSATVNMVDSTLIIPQGTSDFSWFTSAPTEPNITISDADLADNTRNYVEIKLLTENGTPLTKAFWDPEANSGDGSEFNQIVDTIVDLKVEMVVSTGGFSGSVDTLPLCIIDTDSSGNIKVILDRRVLFGRLALPTDINNRFSWGSLVEPPYSMTLTGVIGTFIAGETINIGTETAVVTTGGTTSIAFNSPSGISFGSGNSVTGLTSGATGVVSTIAEAFSGVDKNLKTQKNVNDALMTELAVVKGTRFWWENPRSSLAGIVKFMESIFVQATSTASWKWDGTNLSITDSNVTPSDDVLGYIRIMGRSGDLSLTREDGTGGTSTIPISNGQIMYVKIPQTGSRIFSGSGTADTNYNVVSIASYESSDTNYWIAYREGSKLYIRGYGELESGETVKLNDPELEEVRASIAANLVSANQDRVMGMIQGGTISLNSAGTSLVIASDAYIQIPGLTKERNTISAQTISLPNPTSVAYITVNRDTGVASVRTITVANEDAITLGNDQVVIARRVSNGVMVNDSQLIKPGEYVELNGALGELNRLLGQLKLTSGSTVSKVNITGADQSLLDLNSLSQELSTFLMSFSGAVINLSTGSILAEDDVTPLGTNFTPQSIPLGEYFWYGIGLSPNTVSADNRMTATVTVTPAASSNTVLASAPYPSIIGDKKLGAVLVQNVAGVITLVKISRLGTGSGGAGGSTNVKATLYDKNLTLLPTGTSSTIDGIAVANGDTVLFANLASGNNMLYKVSGVGTSLVWTAQRSFSSSTSPTDGDSVRILRGNSFGDQQAEFDGTNWKLNERRRLHDNAAPLNYVEETYSHSITLSAAQFGAATGLSFSVATFASIELTIQVKETTTNKMAIRKFMAVYDGTNVAYSEVGASTGPDVSFSADVSGGNLRVLYTSGVETLVMRTWIKKFLA